MAERHAPQSAVPAVVALLSGPLVACIAGFLAIEIFFNPAARMFPAALLVLVLLVTVVLGPVVHGVLRKLNWVKWFHYAAASAIVATGVAIAISARFGEWSASILLGLLLVGIVTAVVSWWILRLDRERAERHRRSWAAALGAAVALNAVLIAFNLGQVVFVAAIFTAERRPVPAQDSRHWSEATIAPAEFKFWREDDAAISLPAGREAFLEYVRARGGRHYIFGEGAEEALPNPPNPYLGSPCSVTPDGIDVYFDPRDPREGPRFIAYVSDGKVVCIDPQFSYSTSFF